MVQQIESVYTLECYRFRSRNVTNIYQAVGYGPAYETLREVGRLSLYLSDGYSGSYVP